MIEFRKAEYIPSKDLTPEELYTIEILDSMKDNDIIEAISHDEKTIKRAIKQLKHKRFRMHPRQETIFIKKLKTKTEENKNESMEPKQQQPEQNSTL